MSFTNKCFIIAQHILPKHLLSRLVGAIANAKIKCLKNALIKLFIRHYDVNLDEAISADLNDYSTFNAFFTRALKAHARTFDKSPEVIISPADGAISQIGNIDDEHILQAKGRRYTLSALLAYDDCTSYFRHGDFATVYLAPKDYHRVHMPYSGKLTKMIYVPGHLFSVNTVTAEAVDNLFARNERVICLFDTDIGRMAVIMVGAFFVASIATTFAGIVTGKSRGITTETYDHLIFNKGDELGQFQFGSTVIVLFERNKIEWNRAFQEGSTVLFGSSLAHTKNHSH